MPGMVSDGQGASAFHTTHWSVVVAAGGTDTGLAKEALASLCQSYWYPLYAYVRRRGHAPDDARDLTQGFLANLLEKNGVAKADRLRGSFRSFLLGAMKHFLADEWDKARALKRGGDLVAKSFPCEGAEPRYHQEPIDHRTPERLFERRWALALLDGVMAVLREEQQAAGSLYFEVLGPCLLGERSAQPYAELALRLGVAESTVKVAVHRMRQRYRDLLRARIAQTVASADEVEDELRFLISVLAEG